MEDKNYYQILGVPKGASPAEIKKAYRRLAKQYHPDTHQGDKAAEDKFKEISQAYDSLGDPKKRRQYDQMRSAFAQGFRPGGFDFQGGGIDLGELFRRAGRKRQARPSGSHFQDFMGMGGLGDILSGFMDLGGRRQRPERGGDIISNLKITFDQAWRGGKVKLKVKREEICPVCGGSGAAPGSKPQTCPACQGRGTVTIVQGGFAVSRPCPHCYGRGKIITQPCPECRGKGRIETVKTVSVKIPAGVADGARIRLKGQGQVGQAGRPSGDLIIIVRVKPDPRFTLRGRDLYLRLRAPLRLAARGGRLSVPLPVGKVLLKVPSGTRPGAVFKVKGQGVPKSGHRGAGNLYVTLHVPIPSQPTAEEKELLKLIGR